MMIDAADRGGQAAEAVEELDEAARAFAALCAEVGLLRRAVAGLPDVVAERGPDYGPTLGALAQGLGRVEDGLRGIAAHPVLTLTAEQHARALERVRRRSCARLRRRCGRRARRSGPSGRRCRRWSGAPPRTDASAGFGSGSARPG